MKKFLTIFFALILTSISTNSLANVYMLEEAKPILVPAGTNKESVKKATSQFVFEPNDANTWVKVRAMIENFLNLQWRAGALAGAKPDDAFFVRVGLGETMTAQDILEGKMNIEIGMAAVRPAEFIILKFSHKMQES